MTALYDRIDSLPPRLQMFLAGCPAELAAKRDRINARQDHRDPFDGEDEPPVEVTWPWPASAATVTDVFGRTRTVSSQDGQIRLPLSATPLFVEE
jgi:hypothetical protein